MTAPNHAYPYHERLHLQNFTVFADAEFEFVPGLNVLIGENGTGKTHVMKALYAWQMARHLAAPGRPADYERIFSATYGSDTVGDLQRVKARAATLSGTFGDDDWSVALQQNVATDNGVRPQPARPLFIPAIELMAHARNMTGIMRNYADFDRTCFDFLEVVTAQALRNGTDLDSGQTISRKSMQPVRDLLPGSVEWDEQEQRFYLKKGKSRTPFALVAEGQRKIASLLRLADQGWFRPGTVLFWDEPEVNVNPVWMDEIIEVLVSLAEKGVQIFLATHSYVILKEIDLTVMQRGQQSAQGVPVRFLGLSHGETGTRITWSEDFGAIKPNPILNHYDRMLVRDMMLYDSEDFHP